MQHPISDSIKKEEPLKRSYVNSDVLQEFYEHMISLDGGHLEKSSAELYKQEVNTVLEKLGTDDITDIFHKRKMKDSFLNRDCSNETQQFKPSTKQKYLLIH